MRALNTISQLAVSLLVVAAAAQAQKAEISDAAYVKLAVTAAPKAIADGAAVVRMDKDGKMRNLRAGDNGFTCMIVSGNKMCSDANSMEFMQAMMNHTPPPDKSGLSYMLAGDDGASNTDPYAAAKTADNHWIVTGPHIMILGPASKTMGFTQAKDPDAKKPYMMWVGTPYEHAMVPVAAGK